MNPIDKAPISNLFLINRKKEEVPVIHTAQTADPYAALMGELIQKGICEDKLGIVTLQWSNHSLPSLFFEEAIPLFQELFKERQTLLKEGKSFMVNMGLAMGSFTKWMIRYDQNPHFSCRLHGDFLPYLFFNCLPQYALRVFFSLGIRHFNEKAFTSCLSFHKSICVEIELNENENELHLKDVLNVALLCLKNHIQLNNQTSEKKITKKIVRKELVESGINFVRNQECSDSNGSWKERGIVFLKLKEKKRSSLSWMITHGISQRPTFTVNNLSLPLHQTLGILPSDYWLRGGCRPISINGSSLQSFLDQFFGFIRGEGEWFEFMTLMTCGYTSIYLLNIIGLSAHLGMNRSAFSVDLERILFAVDLHCTGLQERASFQNFLIQAITLCIAELDNFSPPEFTVDNHRYIFKNMSLLTKEQKKKIQRVLSLISRYITDLKDLEPLLWFPVFNSAGVDDRSLEMYALWRNHVSHYVADARIAPVLLNVLLINLKRSASLGDKNARKALNVLTHEYVKKEVSFHIFLDITISTLFLFATEFFLQKNLNVKKIALLTEIVTPLLNCLKQAIYATTNDKGNSVGCMRTFSHYKGYHAYISKEYLAIVLQLKNPQEFIQRVDVSHFAPYSNLKAELINHFSKKELIQDLNCLLKMTHEINSIKNESDGWDYFIPGIDYEKVIPFLNRNLSSENLQGALHLWSQSAFNASQKKLGSTKNHQTILRQGYALLQHAILLDQEKRHQSLIVRAHVNILSISNWHALLPEAKNYCALLLTYFLQIEEVEFGGIVVILVGHVLNAVLDWIRQRSEVGLEETFNILPNAILHVLRFNQNLFEQYARDYWRLKSLIGTASVETHMNKKLIGLKETFILGVTLENFDRKKEFILILIDAIALTDKLKQRLLYKLAREFYMLLKSELAQKNNFEKEKQLEMRQLAEALKEVYNRL